MRKDVENYFPRAIYLQSFQFFSTIVQIDRLSH